MSRKMTALVIGNSNYPGLELKMPQMTQRILRVNYLNLAFLLFMFQMPLKRT